jgi:hypothetical protein
MVTWPLVVTETFFVATKFPLSIWVLAFDVPVILQSLVAQRKWQNTSKDVKIKITKS